MRLTVNELIIKAKKLRYTLVVSSGKCKYSLYYGSGKKKILAYFSTTIEPMFSYLEKIQTIREEQRLYAKKITYLLLIHSFFEITPARLAVALVIFLSEMEAP